MQLTKFVTGSIIGFIFVFIFYVFANSITKNILDSNYSGTHFLPIDEIKPLEIVLKHDGFNIVVLHGKNPNFLSRQKLTLEIINENGENVKEVVFSGSNIGDPSDIRLQFDPLNNSKNKKFFLKLKYESKDGLSFYSDSDGRISAKIYRRKV